MQRKYEYTSFQQYFIKTNNKWFIPIRIVQR